MLKNVFRYKSMILFFVVLMFFASLPTIRAAEESQAAADSHGSAAATFLWIAVIIIAAKLSSLIERWKQPSVLGELIVGVILGNLFLLGINVFEPVKHDAILAFLAEFGVVILLFQIGLESNIAKMRRVGTRAFMVAIVGVVAPFALGTWLLGPVLLPGLDFKAYLFLGAALTATSVGITARVFKDLGKLQMPEAQIILGAAVIDDVMGLVILAVVSAIVTLGAVGAGLISWILAKAIIFLVGAIVLGQFTAPRIGKLLSRIHTGVGMKFTLAVSFGLAISFIAGKIGLAPIVGAFAAGLVLDPVHFRFFRNPDLVHEIEDDIKDAPSEIKARVERTLKRHSHKHVESLLEPVGHLFVPIFFVVTGMGVRLDVFADWKVVSVALGITAVAFVGKYISGLVAGRVSKNLVGFGMVPRGEVGLIFVTIGKSLGVVSDELFSVIVIMVILTTLLTPPILSFLLRKESYKQAEPAAAAA